MKNKNHYIKLFKIKVHKQANKQINKQEETPGKTGMNKPWVLRKLIKSTILYDFV